MTEHQTALFEKAALALRTGRANLDGDDAGAAVNRAYYAAFYAATAALVGEGDKPKSHAGTHPLFHKRFVATGQIGPEVGSVLVYAFNLRQRADYEAIAVTDSAAAADLLKDVKEFVEVVREMVENE